MKNRACSVGLYDVCMFQERGGSRALAHILALLAPTVNAGSGGLCGATMQGTLCTQQPGVPLLPGSLSQANCL